ncbi:cobalamin biosynthesis protein CbiX [Escherichia coli]|uniref:cobalamin biosynthesis protein CbiX n=1 Tax=Escherichia coli TaxID=562 RepID=UPI001116ABBF|nr:cobalamin biosynthesis protein CbiX [Escherichia coli]HBP4483637.1 cobalamin biosynthesis protein CbiX [Escherichia coli]HCX4838530.1 cobalamin biosynthesis protein CbiX [Escherichia coli]HEC3079332.1 cobalamin biosynthesis protein CbiX [Escherichia coli]
MLNKTENNTNISSFNPCSTEGLIAVKDDKGRTRIIQRGLISHTEDRSDIEGQAATSVFLVSGYWITVFLSSEELARKLGITVSE